MAPEYNELRYSIETSFIDASYNSNFDYKTQLVFNDYQNGKKVLTTLIDELRKCEEFYFSVAFITLGGITPLLEILKELENRNIKGKIITTNYLGFSEPKALKKLSELKNIEIKMYNSDESKHGFHTKGYIFKYKNFIKSIVGSSNLTLTALTVNKEWNTKIVSLDSGEYSMNIIEEFGKLWDSKHSVYYNEISDYYEQKYRIIKEQQKIAKSNEIISLESYNLTPNSMQVKFVNNLTRMYHDNKDKALLISATGTGKTYASAFGVRELKPNRVLFLVHREQIAIQARNSFNKVFDNKKSMGIISGNHKNFNSDFIFSTMQMMSKIEVLETFERDNFDIIIIDEVHRSGSDSYKKIMQYFKPKMWLGMSASPYRSDGFDVYKLFDNNIAHEITLQDALQEDLLCPFHYFGITDIEYNHSVEQNLEYDNLVIQANKVAENNSKDNEIDIKLFGKVDNTKKVDYIIKQAEYYGYSGDRVKGLVFCGSKLEAKILSNLFNQKGYETDYLTGEDSIERRLKIIDKLVSNNLYDKLDYIFTVDIFNEGVDIPEINQVILLRPTESVTIFVQQLGRGLRKQKDKEFVVVIDFIGNYQNNFMIPMALFGDKTYNKDNIRKFVRESNRIIPGCSSIHFDEISRNRIYESIDKANFSQIKIIKDSYLELKNKLGKIPSIMDFEQHGAIDIQLIFDNKTLGSYHKFLTKYEKDYNIRFDNEDYDLFIKFISMKFGNSKRIHELMVIKYILQDENFIFKRLEKEIRQRGLNFDDNTKTNLINMLTNNFVTGSAKNTFDKCILIESRGHDYIASAKFRKLLQNSDFYKIISEIIDYGIYKYNKNYSNHYKNTSFNLYSKYTYSDVCRILEWEKDIVALNIGGYKFDEKTKTFPVFINYHKGDDISNTIKYEDRFIGNSKLIAISKSGRKINSEDVQRAINSKELGIQMHLFVRKNKNDGQSNEFYYLGNIKVEGVLNEFIMPETNKTAVEIPYKLETPVREDIFDYLIN